MVEVKNIDNDFNELTIEEKNDLLTSIMAVICLMGYIAMQ